VSLVTAPAVVGEVPRPVQAGLGAGRSDLRLPPVIEPYWGTDPRSGGLHRCQRAPLVPPVYRRAKPDVDISDPDGTLLGSWVFTGENISTLRSALSTSPEELTIQEDGEKFAPFRLSGRVVDGNRRGAVGEAVTRLLSFTDGLRPDRQAISVLAALTSDIVAASEAIVALGSEDEPRNVDLQDIQYGLSLSSWQYLVPDLGGDVVSKVLYTLVDAQERLSTAELAERAGCSTRGMASEKNERVFSELEAAGLLERTDLGAGKATMWRLRLPFRSERCDRNPPLPTMLVGRETSISGVEWLLSDAVFDVFATAADEHGVSYEFSFGDGVFFEATVGSPPERDLSRFTSEYTRGRHRIIDTPRLSSFRGWHLVRNWRWQPLAASREIETRVLSRGRGLGRAASRGRSLYLH
jgi:hypothetical protein